MKKLLLALILVLGVIYAGYLFVGAQFSSSATTAIEQCQDAVLAMAEAKADRRPTSTSEPDACWRARKKGETAKAVLTGN